MGAGAGGWYFIYGRRKLQEVGTSGPSLLYPQCLAQSLLGTPESPLDCQGSGTGDSGKGAGPALAVARVLTLQPAEEIVGLEDRQGSQRAHQDGLTAQEVVHGARIQHAV